MRSLSLGNRIAILSAVAPHFASADTTRSGPFSFGITCEMAMSVPDSAALQGAAREKVRARGGWSFPSVPETLGFSYVTARPIMAHVGWSAVVV
jgi:hypothetical protein